MSIDWNYAQFMSVKSYIAIQLNWIWWVQRVELVNYQVQLMNEKRLVGVWVCAPSIKRQKCDPLRTLSSFRYTCLTTRKLRATDHRQLNNAAAALVWSRQKKKNERSTHKKHVWFRWFGLRSFLCIHRWFASVPNISSISRVSDCL